MCERPNSEPKILGLLMFRCSTIRIPALLKRASIKALKAASSGLALNLLDEWVAHYANKYHDYSEDNIDFENLYYPFGYSRCRYLFIQAMHDMGVKGKIYFKDNPLAFHENAAVSSR